MHAKRLDTYSKVALRLLRLYLVANQDIFNINLQRC